MNFNEAMGIRKTYDVILRGLKEERISYDLQLEGLEKAVKGKQIDYEELLLLSHDAAHAKELAEKDLRTYEKQLDEVRHTRIQEIKIQKDAVDRLVSEQVEGVDRKDLPSAEKPASAPVQDFQQIRK